MEHDLIGITGGGIGAFLMELVSYVSKLIGVPSLTYTQMTVYMLTGKVNASDPYIWVAGFLSHLVVGAIGGCVFVYYYLKLSRHSRLVLKAFLWGIGLWVLTYGFVAHIIIKIPSSSNGLVPLVALVDHSIYGLILGIFMLRYRNTYGK